MQEEGPFKCLFDPSPLVLIRTHVVTWHIDWVQALAQACIAKTPEERPSFGRISKMLAEMLVIAQSGDKEKWNNAPKTLSALSAEANGQTKV